MTTDNINSKDTSICKDECVDRFKHLWEDFSNTYKGELFQLTSGEEGLTSSGAVNALREAKKSWAIPETMCGRWIMTLTAKSPDKGERVLRILTEDLNIEPVELPEDAKDEKIGAGVAGGAIGAAAGYFLPRALGASTILSAAGGVIGAAATALGAVHTVGKKDSPVKVIIEGYMAQLNHYRDRVIEVLES